MNNQSGKSDSRTLKGGEIIYLAKEPSAKWRIRSYECHQGVVAGGVLFSSTQGLPEDWKDREFENPDEASEFAQQEINHGRVLTTGKRTDKARVCSGSS
jgi:hypothetical protein